MEEAAEGVGVFFAVGTGGEGRPVNVDGHFLEEGGSLWLIEWTWMFFRDEDPRLNFRSEREHEREEIRGKKTTGFVLKNNARYMIHTTL